MGRASRRFIISVSVFLLASCCYAYGPGEEDRIFGHLDDHYHHDTLEISYDLTIRGDADRVVLRPLFICSDKTNGKRSIRRPEILIFTVDSTFPRPVSGSTHTLTSEGLQLKGRTALAIDKDCHVQGCSVEASGTDDTAWVQTRWTRFHPNGVLSLSLVPPYGAAWYHSRLAPDTTKMGLAGAIGFYIAYDIDHFQFEATYRVTGGQGLLAKEAIPFTVRYYPGNRTDFIPSFSLSPKYSTLCIAKSMALYEKKAWGVEAGIAFEGPFERLSYSYCTGIGGYHKIGLYLTTFRIGVWKMGTRYEYCHYDHTDMVRVMGVMEGFSGGGGGGPGPSETDLYWENNRPGWHQVLAIAGMVPLIGFLYLFVALGGLD